MPKVNSRNTYQFILTPEHARFIKMRAKALKLNKSQVIRQMLNDLIAFELGVNNAK